MATNRPEDHPALFAPRRGARILLADDDEELRTLLAVILHGEGYEVQTAPGGVGFLRLLGCIALDGSPSDGVDLLITELDMPSRASLELISALREAQGSTPAILMSNRPDSEVSAAASKLQVPHLVKPFALEAFTRTVGGVLMARAAGGEAPAPRVPRCA